MTQSKKKISQKSKKKIIHKTRSEQYFLNKKYFGEEPQYSKLVELSNTNLGSALNWYNYMSDTSESKEYAIEYFDSIKRNDLSKIIKKIPDDVMINSIGWISRLISNGHIINDEEIEKMIDKTKTLEKYIKEEKTDNIIQFPKQSKMIDLTVLESEIDKIIFSDNPVWNQFKFYDFVLSNQLPKTTIQNMRIYISDMLEYYKEVLLGKDEQLNEGYKKPKAWKKAVVEFYTAMLVDVDRLLDNAKKTRKPRTKKVPTIDKLLKKFRIQKQSNEYKLHSLPPEKIIGANEVWLFDTKYKILRVIRSNDKGLSVDRMTIINVDETKSFQKNIGTRSEKILPGILSGTKAAVRKCFEEINRTQTTANPRSSDSLVILRAF